MAGEIGLNIEIKRKSGLLGWIKFLRAQKIMDSMPLYVGIPEEKTNRDGMLNNAQLAYLHSNGSAVNNMPARPFLEPAIEQPEVLNKMANQFKEAFISAMDGDQGGAYAHLSKAGMYGANAAKQYIGSENLAPNAPITIEGGWMRNKVSGKPFYVKGKGSSAPLIDTGSLRSSITYVIGGKGD